MARRWEGSDMLSRRDDLCLCASCMKRHPERSLDRDRDIAQLREAFTNEAGYARQKERDALRERREALMRAHARAVSGEDEE